MENKKMTLDEAVKVLHQVADLAQKAGILSMQDAALTYNAVNITTVEILENKIEAIKEYDPPGPE